MRVFSLPSPMDAGPSMTSTMGTASRPGTASATCARRRPPRTSRTGRLMCATRPGFRVFLGTSRSPNGRGRSGPVDATSISAAHDFAGARGQALGSQAQRSGTASYPQIALGTQALLIETTEDTTRPDSARHAGSIELSVVESILGKCYASEMSGQPVHQPRRSGRRNESESFPDPHKPSGRVS
jgi:hypothetical protein